MSEIRELWPGWETIRVVGKGGFGKVYEVRKMDENAVGDYRSALKVISIPPSEDDYLSYKDDGYDDESITSIFRNQMSDIEKEFSLMAQFKGTSHIVSYEELKIIPNERSNCWDILIRMELLTSLPNYYNQKNGLEETEVIRLGMDICKALELCGRKGIVHRDIKPQNIFINEFGDYKLGDFGIARSMEHTTGATKTGTYAYMAPEVYQGKPYNASVDMYSLGLVLYWLLNERRLPFLPLPPAVPSVSQNDEAQRRRLSGETLPPPKYGSDALHAVILQACACDPKQRFRSIKDMEKALGNLHTEPDEEEDFFWDDEEPETGVLISGAEQSSGELENIPASEEESKTAAAEDINERKSVSGFAVEEETRTVLAEEERDAASEPAAEDQKTVLADEDLTSVFDDEEDQGTILESGADKGEETSAVEEERQEDVSEPCKGGKNRRRRTLLRDTADDRKETADQTDEKIQTDGDSRPGPGFRALGSRAVSMYAGLVFLSMWYAAQRVFGTYLTQSGMIPNGLLYFRIYSLLPIILSIGCTAGLMVNAQKNGREELHNTIHTAVFCSILVGAVFTCAGCIGCLPCGLIFASLIPLAVCGCLFTLLWLRGRTGIPLLILLAVHGGNYLLCSRFLILQRLHAPGAVAVWTGVSSLCLETLGAALLLAVWNREGGVDRLQIRKLRLYGTESAVYGKKALPFGILGAAGILSCVAVFCTGGYGYYNTFSGILNLYTFSLNGTTAFFGILSLFLSMTALASENGSRRKGFWMHTLMGTGFILALWLFGMAVGTNEMNYALFGMDVAAYATLISIGYLFMAVFYAAAAKLQGQGKTGMTILLCCAGMAAGCLLIGRDWAPEDSCILKYTAGWMISMILVLIGTAVINRKKKKTSES